MGKTEKFRLKGVSNDPTNYEAFSFIFLLFGPLRNHKIGLKALTRHKNAFKHLIYFSGRAVQHGIEE